MCYSASTRFVVPFRVRTYVDSIVETCADGGQALVSMVLFGSAAIGGWVETVSDVDILLVISDNATNEDMVRLHREVERIEILHGLRRESADGQSSLEKFVDKLTAHDGHSSFASEAICCREKSGGSFACTRCSPYWWIASSSLA